MRKIIDVRESYEFSSGHLDGAINIPLSELEADFCIATQGLDKNDEIIVYCRSGSRASFVQAQLLQNGFKNVINGINQQTVASSL